MGQGMTQPGGSSAGGFATEMAVGMAMAQQMMQQQGGILGPQSTPAASPPSSPATQTGPGVPPPPPAQAPEPPKAATGTPELLSPGDVANTLGVSEGDVIATIEAGDLKAKKIGSTWRITRAAVDEFLKS
jgi:excisionase family DNA binding protein